MIYTNFRSFLNEPFHTIHILSRRHCKVNIPVPFGLLGVRTKDVVAAAMVSSLRDYGVVKHSTPINEYKFVARTKAQHANSVLSFLRRQLACLWLRNIEITDFLHRFSSTLLA